MSLRLRYWIFLFKILLTDLVRQALNNRKTIFTKPVSLVLIGPPRSGKTTLIQRLLEGVHYVINPEEELPSTPLASQPLSVEIRRLSPTLAILQRTRWIKHDYSGQKVLLVSYFLRKVPDIMQDESVSPGKADSHEMEQPASVKFSVNGSTSDSTTTTDQVPQLTRSSESTQETTIEQKLPSQHAPLVFDTPEDILSAGFLDLTPEEAEEHLGGSMILQIYDTGGQPEYLDVLPSILTGPAVDMLIFRLIDSLDRRYLVRFVSADGEVLPPYVSSYTVEEALFQAYTCVSHQAPPELPSTFAFDVPQISSCSSTLLVGTHKDCVTEADVARIDCHLEAKFKKVNPEYNQLIKATPKQLLYAIDNTDPGDPGFLHLQDGLLATLEKNFQPVQLPISWIMFYLAVKSTKKHILSFKQCQLIATSHDISSDDELKLALWYLSHQFGVLRYALI